MKARTLLRVTRQFMVFYVRLKNTHSPNLKTDLSLDRVLVLVLGLRFRRSHHYAIKNASCVFFALTWAIETNVEGGKCIAQPVLEVLYLPRHYLGGWMVIWALLLVTFLRSAHKKHSRSSHGKVAR